MSSFRHRKASLSLQWCSPYLEMLFAAVMNVCVFFFFFLLVLNCHTVIMKVNIALPANYCDTVILQHCETPYCCLWLLWLKQMHYDAEKIQVDLWCYILTFILLASRYALGRSPHLLFSLKCSFSPPIKEQCSLARGALMADWSDLESLERIKLVPGNVFWGGKSWDIFWK